jgi:hypothetical protein
MSKPRHFLEEGRSHRQGYNSDREKLGSDRRCTSSTNAPAWSATRSASSVASSASVPIDTRCPWSRLYLRQQKLDGYVVPIRKGRIS